MTHLVYINFVLRQERWLPWMLSAERKHSLECWVVSVGPPIRIQGRICLLILHSVIKCLSSVGSFFFLCFFLPLHPHCNRAFSPCFLSIFFVNDLLVDIVPILMHHVPLFVLFLFLFSFFFFLLLLLFSLLVVVLLMFVWTGKSRRLVEPFCASLWDRRTAASLYAWIYRRSWPGMNGGTNEGERVTAPIKKGGKDSEREGIAST